MEKLRVLINAGDLEEEGINVGEKKGIWRMRVGDNMWGWMNEGPYDIDATWAESGAVGGIELNDMWGGGPTCPILCFFF